MSERLNGQYPNLTVIASQAVAGPNGETGIALQTQEAGTIVFRVDQRGIDALRRDLLEIETLLRREPGNA